MIGVYKITNKTNEHCYIGQSIDIARRWKCHISNATVKNIPDYNYPLQKAFRKYGIENFTFEVLKLCKKSELLEWETYFYDKFRPHYNQIRPNENPVFNPTIEAKRQAIFQTEEYKKKCSKTPSAETRKKVSESLKNSVKHKLTHNTPEYKAKMFEIRQRGKRRNKSIVMYNTDFTKTFDSMSACAKWLDENTDFKSKNKVSKIKAVCDGERKSAFGYKYSYM